MAVIVEPGDTVVLQLGEHVPMAQLDEVYRALAKLLPDVKLVFLSGTTTLAVHKPFRRRKCGRR